MVCPAIYPSETNPAYCFSPMGAFYKCRLCINFKGPAAVLHRSQCCATATRCHAVLSAGFPAAWRELLAGRMTFSPALGPSEHRCFEQLDRRSSPRNRSQSKTNDYLSTSEAENFYRRHEVFFRKNRKAPKAPLRFYELPVQPFHWKPNASSSPPNRPAPVAAANARWPIVWR